MRTTIIIILSVLSFCGCGDIISMKKKMIGNYYLVEGDTNKDFALSYHTNNVFVERVPEQVVRCGYSDSLLVAERVDYLNKHSYYIINMLRDGDTARHKETFITGPISEEEYKKSWENKLNIDLKPIK